MTEPETTDETELARLTPEELADAEGDLLRDHLRANDLTVSGRVDELRERLAAFYEAPETSGEGERRPDAPAEDSGLYRVVMSFPVGREVLRPGALFRASPDHPRVKAGHVVLADDPRPTPEQAAALEQLGG